MKYLKAVLAIMGELFVYMMIVGSVHLGSYGSVLAAAGLFALFGVTWRALTKKDSTDVDENAPDSEEKGGTDSEATLLQREDKE